MELIAQRLFLRPPRQASAEPAELQPHNCEYAHFTIFCIKIQRLKKFSDIDFHTQGVNNAALFFCMELSTENNKIRLKQKFQWNIADMKKLTMDDQLKLAHVAWETVRRGAWVFQIIEGANDEKGEPLKVDMRSTHELRKYADIAAQNSDEIVTLRPMQFEIQLRLRETEDECYMQKTFQSDDPRNSEGVLPDALLQPHPMTLVECEKSLLVLEEYFQKEIVKLFFGKEFHFSHFVNGVR